jgi:preprotein translocase subunit YajC
MPADQLIMFAAIGFLVIMMFMNSRKRKKQQDELATALKPGAWVMLTSGIVGELVSLEDDRAVVETTPGTKLTVVKGAVARIVDAPAKTVSEKATAPKAAAAKPAVKKPAAAKPAVKKPAASAAKK